MIREDKNLRGKLVCVRFQTWLLRYDEVNKRWSNSKEVVVEPGSVVLTLGRVIIGDNSEPDEHEVLFHDAVGWLSSNNLEECYVKEEEEEDESKSLPE